MVSDETIQTANHESLAWLDYALRWSRSGNKTKLAGLLECVRSEVVFEMDHAAATERPGRRRTGQYGIQATASPFGEDGLAPATAGDRTIRPDSV